MSPRAFSGNSGVIPEPTVKVRMGEDVRGFFCAFSPRGSSPRGFFRGQPKKEEIVMQKVRIQTRHSLTRLVSVAMLSAVALVLYLLEFPLLPAAT